jgi:cell division protein FtsB
MAQLNDVVAAALMGEIDVLVKEVNHSISSLASIAELIKSMTSNDKNINGALLDKAANQLDLALKAAYIKQTRELEAGRPRQLWLMAGAVLVVGMVFGAAGWLAASGAASSAMAEATTALVAAETRAETAETRALAAAEKALENKNAALAADRKSVEMLYAKTQEDGLWERSSKGNYTLNEYKDIVGCTMWPEWQKKMTVGGVWGCYNTNGLIGENKLMFQYQGKESL